MARNLPESGTRERAVGPEGQGPVIGYTSPYVPAEWIAAHGLQPFRHQPQGGGGPGYSAPAGVCPFAAAVCEEAGELTHVTAWVLASTCDQMRRTADLMENGTSVPVFLLNVPKTWQTPAAHALYCEELRRLGGFLERLGGQNPSPEHLGRAMREHDECRRFLRDLRPGLGGRVFGETLARVHNTGKVPLVFTAPVRTSGVPVAIVGGPLTRAELHVFDLLEKAGARIVLDGTESGERGQPRPFDRRALVEDPFWELADAYFSIPDISRRPNTGLFVWLRDALNSREVRGLIVVRPVWCDLWHAEVRRIRDWAPVPVLELDLSGGRLESDGRLGTRIEAFMESLG